MLASPSPGRLELHPFIMHKSKILPIFYAFSTHLASFPSFRLLILLLFFFSKKNLDEKLKVEMIKKYYFMGIINPLRIYFYKQYSGIVDGSNGSHGPSPPPGGACYIV